MTDEEIRAIFDELRRVGADLGRPPGLALGTGFGPGEFVAWLRALPEDLGHDAFADRLRARVAAAAPLASTGASQDGDSGAPTPPDAFGERRSWPTRKQLELGIDILVHEWDPLGARLGALTREDLDQHAFNLLGSLVWMGNASERENMAAEQIGELEEKEFLVRRSPVEQRRYLARRLCAVVDEHPAPPLPLSRAPDPPAVKRVGNTQVATARAQRLEWRGMGPRTHASSHAELGPTGHEPPALDPSATCAECGVTGTVAFVTRAVEPRVTQYCRECWTHVRSWAWKPPRRSGDTAAGMIDMFDRVHRRAHEQIRSAGSALWEDRFMFAEEALAAPAGGPDAMANRETALRWWARGLIDHAGEMDGPMPENVAAFVREYGTSADA